MVSRFSQRNSEVSSLSQTFQNWKKSWSIYRETFTNPSRILVTVRRGMHSAIAESTHTSQHSRWVIATEKLITAVSKFDRVFSYVGYWCYASQAVIFVTFFVRERFVSQSFPFPTPCSGNATVSPWVQGAGASVGFEVPNQNVLEPSLLWMNVFINWSLSFLAATVVWWFDRIIYEQSQLIYSIYWVVTQPKILLGMVHSCNITTWT